MTHSPLTGPWFWQRWLCRVFGHREHLSGEYALYCRRCRLMVSVLPNAIVRLR